ncbi:hypothetical protein [Anabaena azotica]|uniref:Uncharacterized protein n=1 Tax=Anabaena azotica FACHB-119 TaxID=947527 RepID=A0ABR8DEE0_9NOST|nr:hypothetical protein [Anabaena azotica]MBD2504868.1 hypothetical protein [Anabaena azotica FACHB-119]
MSDSEELNQVINNDLPNSQFGGGLINAESVNAERIGGDVYNIYLGKQQMASDSPTPSPNQQQRSQSQRDALEKTYTIQSQKVASIRHAWVIETDPSRKFQYEQQLQEEERILKELAEKLDAIEQQLQAIKNHATEYKSNQKLAKEADTYFEQEVLDHENSSKYNIADIIEKLKKVKPETVVNSCSTHQECISWVHELWHEATKIAKKKQFLEAIFLLEYGVAIAQIIDDVILELAIDKDLEFLKAKLH